MNDHQSKINAEITAALKKEFPTIIFVSQLALNHNDLWIEIELNCRMYIITYHAITTKYHISKLGTTGDEKIYNSVEEIIKHINALNVMNTTKIIKRETSDILIAEFEYWKIYLHSQQNYIGRMYLWSNRETVGDLLDVLPKELNEFFRLGRFLKSVLTETFKPDKFNICNMQDTTSHMHVHLIPRYKKIVKFANHEFTDANWGRNFIPYQPLVLPYELMIKIRDFIKQTAAKFDLSKF